MKILITGSNGQLGKSIRERAESILPGATFHFYDVEEMDICNESEVAREFNSFGPDYLVNCAAYTAVDKAEDEEEKAEDINTKAPGLLAHYAALHSCRMIHVSTDYVFSGKAYRPYNEEDETLAQGVYGKTKLDGEKAVLAQQTNAIIIRTSWLYSEFGHNFVRTMLKLGRERDELNVVADQIGNPTWAGDLAATILEIIRQKPSNDIPAIYHFSNEGIASWYDLARAIMEIADIDCTVKAVSTEEFPLPAPRPFYSAMDKKRLKSVFGIEVPYWRHSLKECLNRIGV